MSKQYSYELEVRGYELDAYGHVNHAVYISYFEQARWKLLQSEGIGFDQFAQYKTWPVIAAIEIQYLKPCFSGEILKIISGSSDYRRSSFTIHQEMFRDDQPVCRAKVRVAMVDEKGIPKVIPPKIVEILEKSTS